MPKVQVSDAPVFKTKRDLLFSAAPLALQSYMRLRKIGIAADAQKHGLSVMEVGGNDPELAALKSAAGKNWIPTIDEALAGLKHVNFREVDPEPYRTDLPLPDLRKNLADAIEADADIDNAPGSNEDLENYARMAVESLKYGGEADVSILLRGGYTVPVPESVIQVPVSGRAIVAAERTPMGTIITEAVETPVVGGASVPQQSTLAFILTYFPAMADALQKQFVEQAKSGVVGTQIPNADRPKLKAAAAERILVARRQLEIAIVDEEFEGRRPARPNDTDWKILLWLEVDPTKPTLTVVSNRSPRVPQKPMPGSAPPKQRKMIQPGEYPADDIGEDFPPADMEGAEDFE